MPFSIIKHPCKCNYDTESYIASMSVLSMSVSVVRNAMNLISGTNYIW